GQSGFFADDEFGLIAPGPAAGAEFDAVLQLVLEFLQGVVARSRRDLDVPDARTGMPGQPAAVGQALHRARELHGKPRGNVLVPLSPGGRLPALAGKEKRTALDIVARCLGSASFPPITRARRPASGGWPPGGKRRARPRRAPRSAPRSPTPRASQSPAAGPRSRRAV